MESVGDRVGRIEVHLANDAGMAKPPRPLQQMGVEQASDTVAPVRLGNDNPVDIEKSVEPTAKPKKVSAVVVVGLFERQQKRCAGLNETAPVVPIRSIGRTAPA